MTGEPRIPIFTPYHYPSLIFLKSMNVPSQYLVLNTDQLLTPCLLVYPDIIQSNIQAMIRMAGSVDNLRPHVKTHKTAEIVRMELAAGITKHKCATHYEAQMLAECGVPDVLIAYPQIGPSIRKLAELVANYPSTQFSTVVEDAGSAEQLDVYFTEQGLTLDVLVDIDNGMHRTGIPAGEGAIALYRQLVLSRSLRAAGLHIYDGQNHTPARSERDQAVATLMQPITHMLTVLGEMGLKVPKLVCGGTPTFPVFADLVKGASATVLEAPIECSPGTCVLSDYNYGKNYPDLTGIQHAAVLLTRVISKQHPGFVTVDLGNKAVAADPPAGSRCHFLGLDDVHERKHNEEHLIIETAHAAHMHIGDVLYVLPAHICPTVSLHSHGQVVRGNQVVDAWKVTARDRFYR